MRKYVWFSVMFFLALPLVRAQRPVQYDYKLWIGIGGGVNAETVSFKPKVQQETYIAPMGSFLLRWDVERHCSLQVEANYSIQGWREQFDKPGKKYARELRYVEFSLLTHLYIEKKKARFFLNLGPKIGYLLSEKEKEKEGEFNDFELRRHELTVENKLEWGLVGGVGINYAVNRRLGVELEGRFSYNFNDLYSTRRADLFGQASEMFGTVRINLLFLLYKQ